jgi:hypothetical protein
VIRAIGRSDKRLEKLQAAAIHTNGPTATPVEPLVEAVATKPPPEAKLPTLAAVSIADLHKTPEGKAIAKSWDAIPAVKRSRSKRRTPDDFRADMTRKKSTTDDGVDGR